MNRQHGWSADKIGLIRYAIVAMAAYTGILILVAMVAYIGIILVYYHGCCCQLAVSC